MGDQGDGPGDGPGRARWRGGERRWVLIGGGTALAAALVAATVLVIGGGPHRITATPHTCHTTTPSAPTDPTTSTTPTTPAGSAANTASAAPTADFDGDGHPDLAFGSLGSVPDGSGGGSIAVAYGSGDGTEPARCQYLTQDDPGIPGKNRNEAYLGSDVVARDLDEDGYTDLATLVFDWKPSVIVLWGSADGLSRATRVPGTDGTHVPWQFDPILDEQLAAGDFDGDRHTDLVFGLGSAKGLLKGPFQRDGTPADTAAVPAPRNPGAATGSAGYGDLVTGDLNGDGTDDLVTLHSYEPGGDAGTRRPVGYLQGGPDGFTQPKGVDLPEGARATTGDVDGDGYDDLLLSPREGDGDQLSVTVVYGSASGPGKRTTTVGPGTPGVPGAVSRDADAVVTSLDTGDVNGDGYADVVAGAPRDDPYVKPGPEQVLLLLGGPDGLTGEGARVYDGAGLRGGSGPPDGFGGEVCLTDLDGDRRADLVVAAYGDDKVEGSAWLLPATAAGPSVGGAVRLLGDSFDDTEDMDLYLGGGGIAG
ncbi:FG-GAP repeat protein [Streptomyces sp. NPDC023723]|uniref:FG-GAP repeat protein n=1 Tax=Streptomyces sp. NPDC023723 TaxID=3154323 RepID=UPI0033DF2953